MIEALDVEATGTRVVFEWRKDRFHHAIYSVCLGEAVLLAESVEGDAVNPWPLSPPFQQIHKQQHDSCGEVLYMMGMAGKSFWAGSVMASVDLRWTLVGFALSCRYHVNPDWLGVTYSLESGVIAKQPRRESEVVLTKGNGLEYRMAPTALGNSLATEDLPTSSLELQGRKIRIGAEHPVRLTTATTNSWAYSVQLMRQDVV